jgi:hypothetical protein
VKYFVSISFISVLLVSNAYAGVELVCKGSQPASNNKSIYVNCSERKAFVDALGNAWRIIRRNSIGGSMEDMCWQSYQQAKDMHPSISFNNISDSFLMRCNMGLAYVN